MKILLSCLVLAVFALAACGGGASAEETKFANYLKKKVEFLKTEDCKKAFGTPAITPLLEKLARECGYTNEAELLAADAKFIKDSGETGKLARSIMKMEADLIFRK